MFRQFLSSEYAIGPIRLADYSGRERFPTEGLSRTAGSNYGAYIRHPYIQREKVHTS